MTGRERWLIAIMGLGLAMAGLFGYALHANMQADRAALAAIRQQNQLLSAQIAANGQQIAADRRLIAALQKQVRNCQRHRACGPPITVAPAPAASGVRPATQASGMPQSRPTPTSDPRPTPRPSHTHRPSPSPTPTATCLLPIVCGG